MIYRGLIPSLQELSRMIQIMSDEIQLMLDPEIEFLWKEYSEKINIKLY